MIDVNTIPVPSIIEELDYQTIKTDCINHLKTILPVEFIESDQVLLVVEALIYREMLLRARINASLKALFLPTSTGNNLDNLAVSYGITRLALESDDAFRNRILLSLDRFSTAGSAGTYIYQTMSVSSDIKDVKIFEGLPGVVEVVYYAWNDSEELKTAIIEHLNKDTIRPLTDVVVVNPATRKNIALILTVEVLRLSDEMRVKNEILSAFGEINLGIGEDLPLSRIIKTAFVNGVFRVGANVEDINADTHEVIILSSITINCTEAVL